ncbi:putative transporter/permease protein [Rhizophagus clarus]|uniref:Putative transporter/permease protein n=1 Tax=Rhizophagus clarus TaxID=94130 RepID=A0A8H3LHE7_9GLOM|nr:putative transporter/permease protein [Rhizophagus clarus]
MSKQTKATLISIIFHEALFLLSGFFTTLGQQFLYYQGAATGLSLLTNTATYIGMASVGLLLLPEWLRSRKNDDDINMASTTKDYQLLPGTEEEINDPQNNINLKPPKEVVDHKVIFAAACLDVIANFALTIGFFYVGSGMYQVIYSSVVIWCAVLSFFFLGRKVSVVQSISIVGVSIGLALSALGISENSKLNTPPPPSSSTGTAMPHSYHMSSTMFGMIITSFATFGYACVYVVSDQILTSRAPDTLPPSPKKVCFLVGTYGTILSLIYIIFYTIPNWNILITQEMEKKIPHSSYFVIILMYILLCLSSFIHNFAYYWLMKEIGNVSTGILNSLRAIIVFGLSHMMFCRIDHGQCFNFWKGWSAVVVVGFVTVFSVSKARESK